MNALPHAAPADTLLTGGGPAGSAPLLPASVAELHELDGLLRQRLKEIASELDGLAPVLADDLHNAGLGDSTAPARVAEIKAQVERLNVEMRGIYADLARIAPKLDADRRHVEALSETERRRASIAGADRFRRACEKLDAVAADFYAAQAEAVAAQQNLRAASGTSAKVFEVATLHAWACHALRRLLVIELPRHAMPDASGRFQRAAPASSGVLHLIDVRAINPASALNRKSLAQLADETLADVARLFGTRAEAERARDRRDPNRRGTHHVRQAPDGLFEIVEGELRGAAARTAAKTEGTP